MATGFDGVGEAALGGLTARTLEPRAGERGDGSRPSAPAQCLNCGTALTGPFCRHCGQSGHVHRTVGAIGHDLAHGVLHLEGKTWRTLPMLAFRPGELTRRYVAGERARFVSPLAMFLFSVFLMFAIVAQLPLASFDGELLKPGVTGGFVRARSEMADARRAATDDVIETNRRLTRERSAEDSDPAQVARLRAELANDLKRRQEVIRAERMLAAAPFGTPSNGASDAPAAPDKKGIGYVKIRDDAAPESANWLDAKVQHARENPKLLIYKLKTSAYKYSWALIPISLPFIWLLFPFRREVGLYDHAVFATYSLAFMSLLVIVLTTLVALGLDSDFAWLAAMVIVPIHIYKQLKYGYRLSRIGALWRTMWMVGFALFALIFFAVILLGMGVVD